MRLPHIQRSDIPCLPSAEDRTESSESSASLDSEMDARFERLLPKASASFSLVYALPGNHPTLISPSAPFSCLNWTIYFPLFSPSNSSPANCLSLRRYSAHSPSSSSDLSTHLFVLISYHHAVFLYHCY